MSAKFLRRFRLIGLGAALILAIIFKENILLIAGVYWALVILLTIALRFVNPVEYAKQKSEPEKPDIRFPDQQQRPEPILSQHMLQQQVPTG